ncbi:MAG: hypothetical protein ACXWUG_04095 [Polyangiales bacterium]
MNAGLNKVHGILGAIVCIVMPASSWLDGSGRLSYTMFADMHWYRIEAFAFDAEGRSHEISPTQIANATSGTTAAFFAGADRFHFAPVSRTARTHLPAVAKLACTLVSEPRVTVSLLERETVDGPITRTTAIATCKR